MENKIESKIKYFNSARAFQQKLAVIIPVLVLVIVLCVFWWLKLVGITMAGEAFCGMSEHAHTDECASKILTCEFEETEEHAHLDECYEISYICGEEEHIHVSSCYSNINADLETALDWEETFSHVHIGDNISENIVGIATSQLGYTESTLNFELGTDGIRRGYTRYGEWYGNPYGDWSAMFVAFCLNYGGLDSAPVNSGSEAMRLEWNRAGIYMDAAEYSPSAGDIVFIGTSKKANRVGIITQVIVATENTAAQIQTIEGDTENNCVEYCTYELGSDTILGYGSLSAAYKEYNMVSAMQLFALGSDPIAQTITFNSNMFTGDRLFVLYEGNNTDGYYAFSGAKNSDGSVNAVPIRIDNNGNITSDIEDSKLILWSFTYVSNMEYIIQNASTGRYMHAYYNGGGTDIGVTTAGAYSNKLTQTNSGVRILGNGTYAYLDKNSLTFQPTTSSSNAATYQFGMLDLESSKTVWLDGTCGGIMSLTGSPDKSYRIENSDNTFTLPTTWESPEKYDYTLRGWYDIKNSTYYPPGATITVTENMVFYADWVATSYDVGQFNANVADTISTNDFITTRLFDYSVLFNMQSETHTGSSNLINHSETWSLSESGRVPYQNKTTLNFIFRDYDVTNQDISVPTNTNSVNTNGSLNLGIYNANLGSLLFGTDNSFDPETGSGVIGKEYLGTADHLFQYMTDSNDEHYGYYYYDSRLNAASYNQTDERFYVYNYLERTSDSEKDGGKGEYSDFLPFNSPYANTNGQAINTYSYAGENGEYNGTTHYQYDAKYNGQGSSSVNIGTNYWFGMSTDISFYLPNDPGYINSNGHFGNQSIHGDDLCFEFSGDDDVWIFVDGTLVLDLGGMHGVESGKINFSTGEIFTNGAVSGTLPRSIAAGEHTLTLYYLERGSSQSNCSIYFNIVPRYQFTIRKEDVLTKDLLNGAQFTVYTDEACTVEAELWTDRLSYANGMPAQSTFEVVDGYLYIWGFNANQNYYIKETKAPDGYDIARGIICLILDVSGDTTQAVRVIPDPTVKDNGANPSFGFTAYDFEIDEENQTAYLVITNGFNITDTTQVKVQKIWDDNKNHSSDSVTVYLTNGTDQIREVVLSENNNWSYTWTGLPKYQEDGKTPIEYAVEEAYFSGYFGKIEKSDTITTTTTTWDQASSFQNGKTYLLQTNSGCLATTSSTANTLQWLNLETAKTSELALWTATVSGNSVKLINGANQILTFNYNRNASSRYYYATTSGANYQNLRFSSGRLYYTYSNTSYYFSGLNSSNRGNTATSTNSATSFTLLTPTQKSVTEEVVGFYYKITNTPLEETTSLTVRKNWNISAIDADESFYEQMQMTVKLYSNGEYTGRSVVLSLKNDWSYIFEGLPVTDTDGNAIVYTVVEELDDPFWKVSYSKLNGNAKNGFSITITNTYEINYELPETGGNGYLSLVVLGFVIMLAPAIFKLFYHRKKENADF